MPVCPPPPSPPAPGFFLNELEGVDRASTIGIDMEKFFCAESIVHESRHGNMPIIRLKPRPSKLPPLNGLPAARLAETMALYPIARRPPFSSAA